MKTTIRTELRDRIDHLAPRALRDVRALRQAELRLIGRGLAGARADPQDLRGRLEIIAEAQCLGALEGADHERASNASVLVTCLRLFARSLVEPRDGLFKCGNLLFVRRVLHVERIDEYLAI